MDLSSSWLSTLLALAAMLLGLAIAVQVIQEMWKYVTSSRDIAYATVLRDFLGPYLSRQLDRPGVIRDLQVRGPFQFLWWRPSGKLLPMDADELVAALERTTGEWFQRAYAAIRLEGSLQRGTPAAPSASWRAFLSEVGSAGPGELDAHARDIQTFLNAWHPDKDAPLDAAGLLVAFHHQFLPQARKVGDHFEQLMRNYDYQYRRRNLRQTLVIGFLLAVLLDLPAAKLYRQASSLSPEAAAALAQSAVDQYEAMRRAAPGPDSTVAATPDTTLAQMRARADSALRLATGGTDPLAKLQSPLTIAKAFVQDPGAGSRYLLQCLVTALLICFGAPLLNDITKALLSARGGGVKGVATGEFIERTTITAPSATERRI